MKTFRASMILPMFGLLASLAACSGQAPTGTSDGTGSTASSLGVTAQGESAKPEHHGHHMGHGPAGLLFAALKEPIGLTTDQRTSIEAAVATLKDSAPKPPQNAEGFEAHQKALAAAIRANQIDVAALSAKMPAIDPKVEHAAHDAALAKALTTLHDTLSSEQRALLVTAVQKKMAEGPKDHAWKGKHEKGGPQGDEGDKGGKFEGKHMGGFGPMRMLEGLDLSQDQKDAIKAKLDADRPAPPTETEIAAMKANHEAMKKEMDARLQTFATDSFDATAFLAPPSNPNKDAMPKWNPGDRMAKELAVIVPILTPAQRETLATKIEQGPKMHMKKDVEAPAVPQ